MFNLIASFYTLLVLISESVAFSLLITVDIQTILQITSPVLNHSGGVWMDLSHYCPTMLSLQSRHRGNEAGRPLPLSRGGARLCALGSLEPSVRQYCSAHKGERVLQRPQVNRAITSFYSGMRASSSSGASLFSVLHYLPLFYFIFYSFIFILSKLILNLSLREDLRDTV